MSTDGVSSLPDSVQQHLAAAGLSPRPIRLRINTDVSLEGDPQWQWLVVTDDHVTVTPVAGRDVAPHTIAWASIHAFRAVVGVGSGLLQARVHDEWLDLLRYTNTRAHRFHRIARLLDGWAKGGEHRSTNVDPTGDRADDWDAPKCTQCGLRLAARDDTCPRCLPRRQVVERAWTLIAPYWRSSFALCLLTIVGVAAELIPPKLQQYMVDHVLTQRTDGVVQSDVRSALFIVVLALAFSRVTLSIVSVIKGHLATVIGSGLTCNLRKEMVRKLQTVAIAYYDRHHAGSMISRVAHDSEVLSGLMHQLTGGFLLQAVQLVAVGAMLVWLNPKLALFTLIPIPLVFLATCVFWRVVYPRHYRLWDASSKQMSVLSGMLAGIRVVKAFAQEEREYERFETAAERLRDWRLWVEYASARYAAVMQLVFSLGGLIVWYVGGRDVIGQQMTLGQLIAFLAYLSMFYAPLGALSNFTTWLTSFISGSKRVFDLLDTPITVEEPTRPTRWDCPRGDIRFNQVTFGYDRHQPVLRDVSFHIRPGEMIGVVGRSGSGKSTLVNLLSRLYDVQDGQITIDDVDVRDLSTRDLRERLGVVFQDSFLFRGTVWENLAYGRPETTIEAGLQAARAAGAHDFVCRTQLGYETLLGEHGAGLSGGEKQRLSIARTLLYDPKILVFDEATSNIDAEAEKRIQDALDALVQGRTTIAIAHRLSTLRHADRILVFDRGRLVEQGSHAELLRCNGVYARLVRIQTNTSKQADVDRLIAQVEQDVDVGDATDHATTGKSVASCRVPSDRLADDFEDTSAVRRSPTLPCVWLDADDYAFEIDAHGQIRLRLIHSRDDGQRVFLVCAFPATYPEKYLSVRRWNAHGEDDEVGMIRDLAEWPNASRDVVRQSLKRHYLIRNIQRVHAARLVAGYLELDVETDVGCGQFVMRWTQSQAIDFSHGGKLLIDIDENRYVVRSVDQLPRRDRERLLRYIYW